MKRIAIFVASAMINSTIVAQTKAPLPPIPAPQSIPKPAPDTGQPYAPQAILPGGIVVPLFPPNSPYLKPDKVHVPEIYNMSQAVPGRISSIVSIHNPSIEVHMVEKSLNTGTAVIVIAGGGHRTLNVGGERRRLRFLLLQLRHQHDHSAQPAPRRRLHRRGRRRPRRTTGRPRRPRLRQELGHRPQKDRRHGLLCRCRARRSSRRVVRRLGQEEYRSIRPVLRHLRAPDFAGIIYPGPTPFARNRTAPPIPKDVPPAFLVCASAGDRIHTIWALDYYQAMLSAGVPNVEIHLYGNGRHPGDALPDGTRMSGGLTDRNNIPFGTWQFRFIDWARDLGFLRKPGIETKAAQDVASYLANPPRPFGQGQAPGRGGPGRGASPPAKGAPATPAGSAVSPSAATDLQRKNNPSDTPKH